MAKTSLGKVSVLPKGEYSSVIQYSRLDIVTYKGSSYLCIKDSLGIEITNEEYWQLLAQKGDTGPAGVVDTSNFYTKNEIEDLNNVLNTRVNNLENNKVDKVEGKQLSDENYTLAEKNKLAGLKNYDDTSIKDSIQAVRNDLANYYRKNETYSKEEVDQRISVIPKFAILAVDSLPTTEISTTTIYLLRTGTESANVFTEYIYINGTWEKLGTQKLDLSGYSTTEQMNQAIYSAINALEATMNAALAGKVDKVEGKGLSTNDYSNEEKNANAANTQARHTHDNKSTLDKITEEYLQEREDKIDSLEIKVKSIENVLSNKGRLSLMFKNIIDRGEYIIRFPKWATSHNSTGEKLGANAGKVLEFATDTVKENNTYGLAFETIDVNATRKDDGTLVIDAIEGDKNFKRDGLVDVYVAIKKYYEKFWDDEEYVYYGRKFIPSDDYTIKDLCIDYNGEINEFFLIAKHIAGAQRDKEGILKLYSSAGLKPSRYNAVPTSETIAISYNGMIAAAKNKGKYYSGGLLSEYSHIKTTFWLKAGDRNNKGILNGNTSNNYQFKVAQAEEGVTRVIVTTTEANYIDLKSYVSVGNPGTATNFDRGNAYMHNILDCVKVIGKETIDDSHTALLLDCDPVDIPETARVSTMYERSGYCYDILGRNGSPVSCTNGKHGAVLDGIEYMVGGWELISNAVCDILGTDLSRQFLVCNDATKFDTNATNIRNNYYKSKIMTTTGTAAGWRYITEEKFDSAISSFLPTVTGESGSGNTVGYAGGVYVPANTSGLFEVLAFGSLYGNAVTGISSLLVSTALGYAWWHIIARLSLNAVKGETAA